MAAQTTQESRMYIPIISREVAAPILLVDDDDNAPSVHSYYAAALDTLGLRYDVWDTYSRGVEPDAAALRAYSTVIWFTGARYDGFAGPGPDAEVALGSFLDQGGCLFVSSQEYIWDKGVTDFMRSYLGVEYAYNDVVQHTVTGAAGAFQGLGQYTLRYPYENYSDSLQPDGSAQVAFEGDRGNAALSKDNGVYRTTFWGFAFEALPDRATRVAAMEAAMNWCTASCVAPRVPDLVAPANGSGTSQTTPTFRWDAASVATSSEYQLQVDNNQDFSSPEISLTITAREYTPTSALPQGTFFWRVRAHNTREDCDIWSAWSAPWVVHVGEQAQGSWRPFDDTSPWNTPIGSNPAIDPNSDAMIATLGPSATNGGFWINMDSWTVPVYYAYENTPRYDVSCYNSGGRCLPPFGPDVPIPVGAQPDPSSDGHMCIVDLSSNLTWDMYRARQTSGGGWEAEWGYVFDLTKEGVQTDGIGSARASGFPLIAGLIRKEEIEQGYIDHALVMAYNSPRAGVYVYPASVGYGGGGGTNAIPMGGRVQLDPALNLDSLGLSPAGKVIARALQEYGAYVADHAGALVLFAEGLYGKPDDSWSGVLSGGTLAGIPFSYFRVLKLPELRYMD
jgi:hypothetical protein